MEVESNNNSMPNKDCKNHTLTQTLFITDSQAPPRLGRGWGGVVRNDVKEWNALQMSFKTLVNISAKWSYLRAGIEILVNFVIQFRVR